MTVLFNQAKLKILQYWEFFTNKSVECHGLQNFPFSWPFTSGDFPLIVVRYRVRLVALVPCKCSLGLWDYIKHFLKLYNIFFHLLVLWLHNCSSFSEHQHCLFIGICVPWYQPSCWYKQLHFGLIWAVPWICLALSFSHSAISQQAINV